MVDDKHTSTLVVQNHPRGLVRWLRHYHYVSSAEPAQTACGLNIPPGSITRGSAFAKAIGQTRAVCTDCRDEQSV